MTLSTITGPKARKKHYCDGKHFVREFDHNLGKCTDIQKGSIYFKNTHKTDGEFITYRCCLACRDLIKEHNIDDTYEGNL
jgi:hypothetical protein